MEIKALSSVPCCINNVRHQSPSVSGHCDLEAEGRRRLSGRVAGGCQPQGPARPAGQSPRSSSSLPTPGVTRQGLTSVLSLGNSRHLLIQGFRSIPHPHGLWQPKSALSVSLSLFIDSFICVISDSAYKWYHVPCLSVLLHPV